MFWQLENLMYASDDPESPDYHTIKVGHWPQKDFARGIVSHQFELTDSVVPSSSTSAFRVPSATENY